MAEPMTWAEVEMIDDDSVVDAHDVRRLIALLRATEAVRVAAVDESREEHHKLGDVCDRSAQLITENTALRDQRDRALRLAGGAVEAEMDDILCPLDRDVSHTYREALRDALNTLQRECGVTPEEAVR